MKFYSTNHKTRPALMSEAVLDGLAKDGGLFMPEQVRRLPDSFFKAINSMSFSEIAFEVAKAFFAGAVPAADLKKIVEESVNFDAPLVKLNDNIYALELFHGPTLAFKDFGARFMARLMSYLIKSDGKILNVLVATSGDTGSAVASGFYDLPNVRVFILYPSGMVSRLQEKQLTTMGKNITALEIKGSFDDCQKIVKKAFLDEDLTEKFRLTSANSINIARLIPQSFYYFYSYAQVKTPGLDLVFSVPCGNFGNLTAGLFAKKMGLPVARFVAATNINDVFGEYIKSGKFSPKPSKRTISNAMDVGNPSNFARILDLYGHDIEQIRQDIFHARFTDTETRAAIQQVNERYGYVLDPHGAVAYLGLDEYLKQDDSQLGIFFVTAHPAKFPEVVEKEIDKELEIPERLRQYIEKEKHSVVLSKEYNTFKNYLLENAN